MTTLRGTLTPTPFADLAGYRVTAAFQAPVIFGDGAPGDVVAPASRATEAVADATGATFAVDLPDGWREPLRLTAHAPTGVEVGALDVTADEAERPVDIAVASVSTTPVTPSDDPTLGRRERLTGRVLDVRGAGARAGLLVVIWGVSLGGEDADAFPLLVTETATRGYFSDLWPAGELARAWARVAGTDAIPVPLDGGRLPRTVVLVAPALPEPAAHAHDGDDDCACTTVAPPRAPDQVDLTANADAFSADRGRCVDLTVPNRALEEVTFHAVVRTSQPEIKGMTLPAPGRVPQPLIDQLVALATRAPVLARLAAATGAGTLGTGTSGGGRLAAGALAADATGADRTLAARLAPDGPAAERLAADRFAADRATADRLAAEVELAAADALASRRDPVRLAPSVVADLVRDQGELTPAKLLNAERVSAVRAVRDTVAVIDRPAPGRVALGAEHVIDWDDTPTTYQATTIAHGHLLTMKQVWRADGYSLGDLLYSLPLAPGQKKLIAVVDWERREDAARQASRRETESLAAELVHDRDISEIIETSLTQQMRGRSSADVESVAGGIAGFIGPVVFGLGGGVSSAGSSASQSSFRTVTGTSLNQARDRTLQAASSVRSQRATVVQTARQGESLRVQTDVVANHNHCHALTVEYFEVLRHFQVTQELAHVQECLFVPFEITPFTPDKALRHRGPLARVLRRRDLAAGFDALERIRTNWVDADFPVGRYADEPLTFLDGELWMTFALPRPKDTDDDLFDAAQWGPYATLLSQPTETVWGTFLGIALPKDRDWIWNTRIAPRIAERLVDRLALTLVLDDASQVPVAIDTTLVSRFAQDQRLLVSLRPTATTPAVARARIRAVRLSLSSVLPATAKVIVQTVSVRYRTAHMARPLFPDHRADNDIGFGDNVEVPVGLDREEKRNPRAEDRRLGDTLVAHLNEHVEQCHEAIWRLMDENWRFLLLDGFVAPNAGGRSVASVVENRLIGIVGNCLVMPVVPGIKLDPSYEHAGRTATELIDLYAADPVPPARISVPTRGVFAEAVMGVCNSCEVKDDRRFWRWEEAPIPDEPTAIDQISTATRRRAAPSLTPDEFPAPVVGLQNVPKAPAMAGLAAALELIGTPNLFGDLTGLALNQQASAEAFDAASKTATFFAQQGAALAQQRFLNREMDRTLKRIKDARDSGMITPEQARTLARSALKGGVGERRPAAPSPTDSPAVQRTLDRVAEADNSTLKVERPDGTVEVKKGNHTGAVSFAVKPAVVPVQQTDPLTCWAAAGAMMHSWRKHQPMTTEAVLDELGGDWRAKFDAKQALTAAEVVGFTGALGLRGETTMGIAPQALARLLERHGPLWVIGDDAIEGNRLAHVTIVTGVTGDGSPDRTTVTVIDPARSGPDDVTYREFARRLDARDVVELGLGAFHY